MNLNLPHSIEISLRQQAAAAGMDVEQFVILALQASLSSAEAAPLEPELNRDKWKEKFDNLRARFPIRRADSRVDCSRASIYGDSVR